MPHFDRVVIVQNITDEEIQELRKKFGWKATVTAKWSYNGEIVDCAEEDLDRLDNDEGFAEKVLENSNLRL